MWIIKTKQRGNPELGFYISGKRLYKEATENEKDTISINTCIKYDARRMRNKNNIGGFDDKKGGTNTCGRTIN